MDRTGRLMNWPRLTLDQWIEVVIGAGVTLIAAASVALAGFAIAGADFELLGATGWSF